MSRKSYYQIPAILSRAETQDILHVSKTTMLRLIQSGQIKASRIGKKYLIQRENLIEYIEKNEI